MSERAPSKEKRTPIHKRVGRALGRLAGKDGGPSDAFLEYQRERQAEHEALAKKGREGRAKVEQAVKEVVDKRYGKAFDRLKDAVAARKPEAEKAVTRTREGLALGLKWDLERKVKTESIGSRPTISIEQDMSLSEDAEYVSEMVPTEESLREEVGKVDKEHKRKAYEFDRLSEWASTAAGGERAGGMIGQRQDPESKRKSGTGSPRIDNEYGYSADSVDMIYSALGAQRPDRMHEAERIRRRRTDGEDTVWTTVTPAGVTIEETFRIGKRGDEYMPPDSDKHLSHDRLKIGIGPAAGREIEGELQYITFYPASQRQMDTQLPAA